jgi:hypothetical protein
MTSHNNTGEYLIAVTADGMLIIHSSPPTLSWVPHDVVNNAYNFGGIVIAEVHTLDIDGHRVLRHGIRWK